MTGQRYADALAASEDMGRAVGRARRCMPLSKWKRCSVRVPWDWSWKSNVQHLDTLIVGGVGGGGLIGGIASWYSIRESRSLE